MTSRYTAETEQYHVILTLWASAHARTAGHALARLTTGVLSATGGPLTVPMGASTLVYHRALADVELSQYFSGVVAPVQLRFAWLGDGLPSDVAWSAVEGELALIDEASAGTTCDDWSRRRVLLLGKVRNVQWGTVADEVSLTLTPDVLIDAADWYAAGAELTSARFADIASTDARSRAVYVDGLLPPIVWAPAGTSMEVPLMTVVDEVSATGIADLEPRRWLIGYYQPTNTDAIEENVLMLDPDSAPTLLLSPDSTTYEVIPASALDGQGEQYWYLPGDWRLPFGLGSTHWEATHDYVVSSNQRRRVRVGWQIRNPADTESDWIEVLDIEGTTITIGYGDTPSNYTGPTAAGADGESIALPVGAAVGAYYRPTYGGVRAQDGGALSNVVDVLVSWCDRSSLAEPICTGDLVAMRSRLAHLHVSWFTQARGRPWDRVVAVLRYLPIRWYRSGGMIRFRWVGPYSAHDIRALLTIVPDSGVERDGGISMTGEHYPVTTVRSSYSHRLQQWRRTTVFDGTVKRHPVTASNMLPHVRASRALSGWRDVQGKQSAGAMPNMAIDLDWVHDEVTASVCASTAMRDAAPYEQVELVTAASARWLEVGDLVAVTEPGVLDEVTAWRIEAMRLRGGELRLSLRSVECPVGDWAVQRWPLYPEDVWSANPAEMWP